MMTEFWVNIGSSNSVLPDGAKPLPKLMLTYHWRCSEAFNWLQFQQEVLMNLIDIISSEVIHLTLLLYLTGISGLTRKQLDTYATDVATDTQVLNKVPGHQYPLNRLNIHCIGPISYKNIVFI